MGSIYDDPEPIPLPQKPANPFPTEATPVPENAYVAPGIPPEPTPAAKKSGCGCMGCFLGCLGVLVVLSVLVGIGAWIAFKKAPDFARNAIAKLVDESDMGADDKRVVKQQVDRIVDGYKSGKIDGKKIGEFAEKFVASPLMDLMVAFAAKVKYVDPSGLTPEEKAEADKTLHRIARGVIEKKIPQDKLKVALNHISNEQSNGSRQFRNNVSDTELRAFLAECKKLADEAEIPDDEVKIDIGSELKKLVDEVLGESTPEPPPAGDGPPAAEAAPAGEAPPAAEAPPVGEAPAGEPKN